MRMRLTVLIFAAGISPFSSAQQNGTSVSREIQTLPEELVITGDRSILQLRAQMIDAEKNAYDIFNKFNDEKRFKIGCNMHQPTGTRFETQICQPEFERRAMGAQGQVFLQSYQAYLDSVVMGGVPNTDGSGSFAPVPAQAVIASNQEAYKQKMREVAEEHPEFLNAIIRYSDIREQYEEATSTENTGD